ncbi:sugar ABC transporter permease [Paenibacillus sp. N3.4]|uniref:ABC transporter permease n=1 Tax=Paenibacillus sp. N3.4 TaxID=2603222 RepID=UPI0021C43BEA|nr:ABC transporter permease subunit [Paenibacillus sp. N3.4]
MEFVRDIQGESKRSQKVRKHRSNIVILLFRNIKKAPQLYILSALPILYILIFKYVPMYGVVIAFQDYVPHKGFFGSDWVGLKHFKTFFNSYEFWKVIKNTLGISFYGLLAGFPFPILLALCLNYVGRPFVKKSVQMVTYAPHFISIVVMIGIIMQLLDPKTGIVNMILAQLGFEKLDFFGNPNYFKSLYVWSGVWQNVGYGCIIYLAALAAIDPSLHEAAVMDGASKIQRMWHVDIPGILPVAIIIMIMSVGHMMDAGFEKVLLMQNPLNLSTSEVIDTYVYKVGLLSTGIKYSYATAIGVFTSVVNLILLFSVNKLAKKLGQTSLW